MTLQFYNSLSRQKQIFEPIQPGKITLYVCGMTVYDHCHIGHARTMIAFDVITRYLRFRGYDVTYVRNITDIDDKIIKRASDNGESISTLTERFIQAMHEDEQRLGNARPDLEPRATEHMPQIIAMIETLIHKNLAYVADNGDVYYAVHQFSEYGKLSNKSLDELQVGARIAIGDAKRDPLDFVLWKKAKVGEPSWSSPWGEGRPGWHIECSAMSEHTLGATFDIHGGGGDLKFPHHDNEIAQSEGAHGKTFVNYWLHIGFVRINQEKMSKSLGNFFTIREVLDQYKPEVVRYFLLASHYRSPVDYSQESLNLAQSALDRLYQALRGIPVITEDLSAPEGYEQRFIMAMDDDFNTPEALAVLFELSHEINRFRDHDSHQASVLAMALRRLAGVFGLLQEDPDSYFQRSAVQSDIDDQQVAALIQARQVARENKNWAEADTIRERLDQLGIVLEDAAGETLWRRK